MHMSAQSPRTRPSQAVFVRRRIAVLTVLLIVVAAVAFVFVGPERVSAWFSNDTESIVTALPHDEPGNDSSTELMESESPQDPDEIGECDPAVLIVEAVTDETSYAADQHPRLALRITNSGDVDCHADLGTTTMLFEVRSGSDLYWSSRDCQKNPQSNLVLMKAGQSLESDPLEWDRTRSSPETCDIERTPAPAGGASYHLAVEIAGVPGQESRQFLLY